MDEYVCCILSCTSNFSFLPSSCKTELQNIGWLFSSRTTQAHTCTFMADIIWERAINGCSKCMLKSYYTITIRFWVRYKNIWYFELDTWSCIICYNISRHWNPESWNQCRTNGTVERKRREVSAKYFAIIERDVVQGSENIAFESKIESYSPRIFLAFLQKDCTFSVQNTQYKFSDGSKLFWTEKIVLLHLLTL